tara:strand:+ start:2850 stop:3074 length:225 start_codon:yes stop_codon:yes gene_type:complete
MASLMVFQPKGAGTEHKEGTLLVQATVAAGTDWYGSNYEINSSISGLATGILNEDYRNNNTGCAPCFSQCGPCQ